MALAETVRQCNDRLPGLLVTAVGTDFAMMVAQWRLSPFAEFFHRMAGFRAALPNTGRDTQILFGGRDGRKRGAWILTTDLTVPNPATPPPPPFTPNPS